MNNDNKNCCVCFKEDALIPLNATDTNNETILSKLESVVSEVQWKSTFSICPGCLRTLDVVLDFRNLCLKSSSMRFIQESERHSMTDSETGILKADETNSEGELETVDYKASQDSVEISCKICKIELNSHEHLYQHNEEIQKYGPYNCIYCSETFFNQNELDFHKEKSHEKNSEVLNKQDKCSNIELTCEICDKNFSTKTKLDKHIQTHSIFVCYHCGKSYKNKVVLANHIQVKHEKKEVQCSQCDVNCGNEAGLRKHLKLSHGFSENKSFKCSKCEKSYKTEKVMMNHFETCDGVKRHSKIDFNKDLSSNKCGKCHKFYTTEKILKAHMKNCNNSKISSWINKNEVLQCAICELTSKTVKTKYEHVFKEHGIDLNLNTICKYCYKNFNDLEELQAHFDECHEGIKIKLERRAERSYTCEICSKIFGFVKDVIEHCVQEHHMDRKTVKPYLCDKCNTRFTSSANMIQHKQYHEGDRSHICSFCGKSYVTKSDLTVHEYTHLNKRNYKCKFCERAFNTNKNLRSHNLVVHTDRNLWKYQCDLCSKKFPLKSGYDQHIRRHSGDKRFKCSICEKSFISSSELRKHMAFHSNERAFKCPHCDKDYKDRRVCEIHLKKVHGIGNIKIPIRVKRFACHICPSIFNDKQKLTRHLCTHMGIKPYACTSCDKRFTDKSYLKHHMKVTHNIVNAQIGQVENNEIFHFI